MTTNINPSQKYLHICRQLKRQIRDGHLKPGERLPAERQMAMDMGVSYMTLRRAIGEMVDQCLLERRPRLGIFVRRSGAMRLTSPPLHLICAGTCGPLTNEFIRLGSKHATRIGRRPLVIWLNGSNDREAITALRSGEPCIVMPDEWVLAGSIGRAMGEPATHPVIWGNKVEGIPSVVGETDKNILIAVRRLQESGHRRIALVVDRSEHRVAREMIDAWRSATDVGNDRYLICAETSRFECPIENVRIALRKVWSNGRKALPTAVICADEQLALTAISTLVEAGYSVPGDVSVINCLDGPLASIASPPLTSVDANLNRHFEFALELAELSLKGRLPKALVRTVEPRLVERESVAMVKA